VVLAGEEGEGGRDEEDLRAPERLRAVELGEAQVVADRQPDRVPLDLGRDDLAARGDRRRLPRADVAGEFDVVEVILRYFATRSPRRSKRRLVL
jgi:hypothetical protein